jgi:hypothetical protein
MAKNWIAIRVSLIGGGGIDCDPSPGRVMIVGPRHTFADLAKAIDAAFARWDLSHLHLFEFPDRRLVGEPSPDWHREVLDEGSLKVVSTVGLEERFIYVFDLGAGWRHECEVQAVDVDPVQSYGIVPRTPVPIWGWGWIPDQYGRRIEDDTGADEWEFRWVRVSDEEEG